jgi:hypothetical protein
VFAIIKTLMEALLERAADETYETFRKLIIEVHSISLKLFCSFSDALIGYTARCCDTSAIKYGNAIKKSPYKHAFNP